MPPEPLEGGRPLRLSRGVVLSILFFLFAAAYLFTPYWKLAKSPSAQIAWAVVAGAVGLAWAFLASGPVELRPGGKGFLWFLAALAIVGVLNSRLLFVDLAWRGDEDHHFKDVLMLAAVLKDYWLVLVILLAPLAVAAVLQVLGRAAGRAVWIVAAASAAAGAAVVIAEAWTDFRFSMYLVGHYPPGATCLAAPLVAVAKAFSSGINPPEVAFRIVPFLSTVLLAWHCARKATGLNVAGRLLYILAIGSIPLILYFSSILYLEMPAILLLTVVCLGADDVLATSPEELVRKPAWYALILAGFIKDSIPGLLGAVILARWWVRLGPRAKRGPLFQSLVREAIVAACVVAPYATFWIFRTFCTNPERGYSPNPGWLFELSNWATVLWALLEQYGPTAVVFPAVVLFVPQLRKTPTRLLLVLMFAVWAVMHIMDRCISVTSESNGTGFSRYMLLFAPPLIAGLHEGVRFLSARRVWVAAAGLLLIVGVNLAISPIHLDGARQPGWGEYRWNFSEHTYPYRSALEYIQANHPKDRTLLTGFDYQYWYEYYTGPTDRFAKAAVPPGPSESRTATELLGYASQKGFQHVLYHVMGPEAPRPPNTFGFTVEKTFQNSVHMLVLYSAAPATAATR